MEKIPPKYLHYLENFKIGDYSKKLLENIDEFIQNCDNFEYSKILKK